jgi:hypothetical protein
MQLGNFSPNNSGLIAGETTSYCKAWVYQLPSYSFFGKLKLIGRWV